MKLTVVIVEEYYCYKILSSTIVSGLTQYTDKVIGDHQCGFQCHRSNTDQIF